MSSSSCRLHHVVIIMSCSWHRHVVIIMSSSSCHVHGIINHHVIIMILSSSCRQHHVVISHPTPPYRPDVPKRGSSSNLRSPEHEVVSGNPPGTDNNNINNNHDGHNVYGTYNTPRNLIILIIKAPTVEARVARFRLHKTSVQSRAIGCPSPKGPSSS